MASEIQIQKKNLEAELATIRDEIEVEAFQLTDILRKKSAIEQDAILIESKKTEFSKYESDTKAQFEQEKKGIENAKARSSEEIALNNTILKKIKDDIKEAIKQLSWLNEKIMNADALIIETTKQKNQLDIEIADLLMLVSHKEDEERKLQKAIDSRSSIESAIENKKDEAHRSVELMKVELDKMKAELAENIKERDRVQAEAKTYTDQLYTAMNDWHAVRNRLEIRFHEHYPELELPLMT